MRTITGVGVGVGFGGSSGSFASNPSTSGFYTADRYDSNYDALVNQSGATGLSVLGAGLYTDRARIYGGVGYIRGVANNAFSTPDSALLDITGDIDIRTKWTLSNWSSPSYLLSGPLVTKWLSWPTGRNYGLFINADGTLRFYFSTTGADFPTAVSSVSTGTVFSPNEAGWVRVTRVQSTGVITFYTSTDGVTWNQLGTTTVVLAGTAIYAGVANLAVGAAEANAHVMSGIHHYSEVRSGIDGTVVAKCDPSSVANYAYGWVSSTGEIWRVNVPTAYSLPDFYKVAPAQLGSTGFYTNARVWGGVAYIPTTVPNYFQAPRTAAMDTITSDLDLKCEMTPADWTPSADRLYGRWGGGTQSLWLLTLGAAATLTLYWYDSGGTLMSKSSTAAIPFLVDGTKLWVRATLDADNGAGSYENKFYYSFDGITWIQLGATVTTAGSTSIRTNASSAFSVGVGLDAPTSSGLLGSSVSRLTVSNTIDGNPVIDFNPALVADLATSWTSATGEVYSAVRTAVADTNDPLRLVYAGEKYAYLPAISGNYISTPDSALLDITGDIDLRCRWALSSWSAPTVTGGEGGLITKYRSTATTRSYGLYMLANGQLRMRISTTGADSPSVDSGVSASTVFSAGQAGYLRVTRVASSGLTQFFTSPDGITWTQLGTDKTLSAGSAMYSGAEPVTIGSAEGGTSNFVVGNCHYSEIRSGVAGTIVAKFDASLSGQTGYTDPTNSTVWTINRTASGKKMSLVDRTMLVEGTDDFLEVADHQLLDFGTADSMTAAVAYREFGTLASATRIAKKNNTGSSGAGYLIRQATGVPTTLVTEVTDGSSIATTNIVTTPTDGDGTLSAVVRTSGTGTTLNSNGSTATDVTNNALALSNAEVLRVGRLSGGGTGYADQEAFGFAVIRRPLTALELASLRQQLKGNA